MSVPKKFTSLLIVFALLAVLLVAPAAQAQEMTETPVVCDSTLVTLLLVAEHDYDYLSDMMMMADNGHMPNVDLGQFKPIIDSITAMMMAMPQMSDSEMQMMATEEAQTMDLMAMSDVDLMKMWVKETNMTGDVSAMTMLTEGAVAGEDPACSALRTDVQHFLLVHIVADMMHADMMGSGM